MVLALDQVEQVLYFSEMGQDPDMGFALFSVRFDDPVIGISMGRVALQ
jgi:hypothetical protein